LGVDLAGRRAHDEAAEGVPGAAHVGEAAHEVDGAVGEDDAGLGGVLDGVLGLALLAADARNTAGQVVALQVLHVLYLERLQEEVVQPQHRDRVLQREPQHERAQEVVGALDGRPVLGLLALPDVHRPLLGVHPDLQLHVLDHRLADLLPVGLQRSHAVGRNHHRLLLERPLPLRPQLRFLRSFDYLLSLHC
jgi:hypothetical protein